MDVYDEEEEVVCSLWSTNAAALLLLGKNVGLAQNKDKKYLDKLKPTHWSGHGGKFSHKNNPQIERSLEIIKTVSLDRLNKKEKKLYPF